MSTTSSQYDFREIVRKSGLLTEEALMKFSSEHPALLNDAKKAASMMQQMGLLTSFQVKRLLSGKYQGFMIGPYKVLEQIGKGGMGAIFLAEHTTLQRRVAIKVLPVEKVRNQELLQRFYREARAAAALDHPNIVKLFDVSQGAGTHYLVMEYVPGRSLQKVVASNGPIHFQMAIHYIMETAKGLKHAHQKGFVHRDIKPDNIMLSTAGTIKILDMGLARSLNDEDDNVTKMMNPNAVYGSVDYISPEQSIGGTVDARSDLYSLGATLFALITGVPPFSGTPAQILVSHQLSPVPDLTRFQPSLPPQLNAILAKLMAKKPEKRYRNAGEVIDALVPCLPSDMGSQTQVSVSPLRQYETIKVISDRQPSSINTKQTPPLKPGKKKKKVKPQFNLSPKAALAILGGGMGLVIVTLFLLFITGRSTEQANEPKQQPISQNTPANVDFVSKNPRTDVVAGNCVFLDLSKVANVISTKHIFIEEETQQFTNTIPLPSWGRSTYHGVPFDLINPQGTTVPNILIFGGGDSPFSKNRPTSVSIPCNTNAKVIHVLGGISGWAYPHITARNVVLIARIRYRNGLTEEHQLSNGTHFADWKMPQGSVPTAPVVVQMDKERHLRYFSIEPKSRLEIAEIEFIKDEKLSSAPIFFAITVEKP